MARKTTRKEKREYKQLKKHLEEFEKAEAKQEKRELKILNKGSSRKYFRLPDGRLCYVSPGGFGVDLDDPATAKIYTNMIAEKYGQYKLKDGKLVKNPDAPELPKKEAKWHKAKDYVPTETGEYLCMTESGFLKKKVEQQKVKFRHIIMGGEWITDRSTRVVYWLEE